MEALLRHENHHVTHTTLQFSKDKKALSATTERLGGKSSAPPDRPKAPLSTPRSGTGNHILLAKQQRNLKLHYRVYLVQELFLFRGFGNLPKQGQSLGCSVLRAITHLCHCLLSEPLVHLAFCLDLLITCTNDHFTIYISQPHSQGQLCQALQAHWTLILLGAAHPKGSFTSQGKLHVSLPSTRIQPGPCRVQ